MQPRSQEELRLAMESLCQGGILKEQGLELRPSPLGGRGLFATRAMPHGAEIKIPLSMVLDATSAAATELGRRLKERGISGQELVVAVLADAKCRPDDGGNPYGPYARILPESPDAASWGPQELGLLVGTDLGSALADLEADLVSFEKRLRAALEACCCAPIPLEAIRWARGMLLSRRFPAVRQDEGGGGEGAWGLPGTLGTPPSQPSLHPLPSSL